MLRRINIFHEYLYFIWVGEKCIYFFLGRFLPVFVFVVHVFIIPFSLRYSQHIRALVRIATNDPQQGVP